MVSTASELAQQAITAINALKALAENSTGMPDDVHSQLEAYANQVNELEVKLENQENATEMYRNEVLSDSEYMGFAIEIMSKIQGLLSSGVIKTMPVDVQRQLSETAMYISERRKNDEQYRLPTDPKTRTFSEFRNPV